MRHIFIVNPTAGKADASKTFVPKLIETLAPMDVDYDVILTEYPRHATEIAEKYARTGEPIRLYACGGDGTLNEVLTGAYRYPNAEVGCVPCGSGNDLIKNFGSKAEFLDIPQLIDGTSIKMDLIDIDGEISASICSAGLDAKIAYGIPKYRRIPGCGGHMAYNISIVECLLSKIGNRMRVTIDGVTTEDEYLLVCVANGICYGGGYKSAPLARLDDGLLDIVLVKKISRLRIAAVIAKYKNGTHIENGEVIPEIQDCMRFIRGRDVTITSEKDFIANVDGECGPRNSFHAVLKDKAASFVLPQALAERYLSSGMPAVQKDELVTV